MSWGLLRKKFIPNRRKLGLTGRFDWEIDHLERQVGAYTPTQELSTSIPYAVS